MLRDGFFRSLAARSGRGDRGNQQGGSYSAIPRSSCRRISQPEQWLIVEDQNAGRRRLRPPAGAVFVENHVGALGPTVCTRLLYVAGGRLVSGREGLREQSAGCCNQGFAGEGLLKKLPPQHRQGSGIGQAVNPP